MELRDVISQPTNLFTLDWDSMDASAFMIMNPIQSINGALSNAPLKTSELPINCHICAALITAMLHPNSTMSYLCLKYC